MRVVNVSSTRRRVPLSRAVAGLLAGAALVCTAAPVRAASCGQSVGQSAPAGETLLETKVVTASKFAQSISDAPGVMSVISRDDLQRWGGVTLAEVLERVPGLNLSSAYFTDRSIVAARGDQTKINGGHVLFLINGRPTREVLEGGLVSDLLESFPVAALDHIEVIKGPGSVLYGSNAFSAVVNLITKHGQPNGFSVSARPGRDNTMASMGEGSYRCGSFSLVGSAQMHQKADWTTGFRSLDPVAPAVFQDAMIPNRSHGGYIGASFKGLSVSSSYTDWQTASFVRGTIGAPQWKRGFADVSYEFSPSSRWTSTVSVTYTRNTFSIAESPNIKRDSNEKVLEWTNILYPTNRDQVTVGALYNHVEGGETYYGLGFPLPISDGNRNGSGVYAQVDHVIVTGLKGVGGFQANKIGNLDLSVVPRAGLIWLPSANFTVKALYGEAFRAPSINETTLNHPQLAGMPGLLPEKVGTFDLELTYQNNSFQGRLNFFRSRQTDSITIDTSTPRWSYANLGTATFRGVEVEGKYYVTKQFFFVASVFHQGNESGDGATNITPIPNNTAKAGLSYDADNGLTVGIFDSWVGDVSGYMNTLNPAAAASHMVTGRLKFDVSRYFRSMGATGLSFLVDARNLTNNQLWLPDLGGGSGDTIPMSGGRTVYVGAELSLNRTPRAVSQRASRD
jgi:outer membrane receptor for ferrienterochelin and colicins